MPEPNSHSAAACESNQQPDQAWREELRIAIRSASELCRELGLDTSEIARAADDEASFSMLVPRSFVQRMRHGDPDDPLLLQVLAQHAERLSSPQFGPDPLNETDYAQSGVVHKYARRALLITTAACPVHCRYCFRREFPYSEQLAARDGWEPALDILRTAEGIDEVILSGGDPLSLSTQRLSDLIRLLESIPQIETLRIHTRFPIILPSRITTALTDMLATTRLRTVIVLHCNHANELDAPEVIEALEKLCDCSDFLLNQAVMLNGINDSVTALAALSDALFRARVMPYYINMLDRVTGSAHFEVSENRARELIRKLRTELPGYLVPTLVRDTPGALSKVPLI